MQSAAHFVRSTALCVGAFGPSYASVRNAQAMAVRIKTVNAGQMHSSRYMGFSPFMKPVCRRANPDEETTDWRAVCGKTARTVRRAGRGNSSRPLSGYLSESPCIQMLWVFGKGPPAHCRQDGRSSLGNLLVSGFGTIAIDINIVRVAHTVTKAENPRVGHRLAGIAQIVFAQQDQRLTGNVLSD